MLRSVFGAAVWSRRRGLAWWVGGSFVYLLFLGAAFPTIQDNAADFEKMLDSYPEALRAMFNMVEGVSLGSGAGFLHMELYSFVLPLLLIIFAVGFGARAVAGEEEEGTLDLLLSGPVSRRRWLSQQFAALAITTFAIGLVNFVAILLAGAAFGMGLDAGHLAAASLGVVLIALVVFTMVGRPAWPWLITSRVLGIPVESLIGRSLLDCHNQVSQQTMIEILAAMQSEGLVERLITDNEKHRIYMRAVRDGEGRVLGYYERYDEIRWAASEIDPGDDTTSKSWAAT